MADALQAFIIAGTPNNGASIPREFDIDLGPSEVTRIVVTWPAGCGGLLFIQIRAAGGYAFPSFQNQYMAFDDYTYTIDVANQTNSGKWSVMCDNRDFIGHDPQVVFEYNYLRGANNSSALTPISL